MGFFKYVNRNVFRLYAWLLVWIDGGYHLFTESGMASFRWYGRLEELYYAMYDAGTASHRGTAASDQNHYAGNHSAGLYQNGPGEGTE